VVTNNHFRGQAVVNALQMKASLEEKPVPAPPLLVEKYPELSELVTPETEAPPDSLFT
jgi:hypothetical protein